MVPILLRSVIILAIVLQYTISIWNSVDLYFSEQFKKHHNLQNTTTENETTDKSLLLNVNHYDIRNSSHTFNKNLNFCLKSDLIDMFINYCPKNKKE